MRLKMINKSGDMFMGEILHPKGDIGLEILKRGLGRALLWTLIYSSDHTSYVNAEKRAKANKTRLWKTYDENELKPIDTYTGIVIEIVSGDTIVVLNERTEQEERVCLSSIRAKRMGSKGKDPEPYVFFFVCSLYPHFLKNHIYILQIRHRGQRVSPKITRGKTSLCRD